MSFFGDTIQLSFSCREDLSEMATFALTPKRGEGGKWADFWGIALQWTGQAWRPCLCCSGNWQTRENTWTGAEAETSSVWTWQWGGGDGCLSYSSRCRSGEKWLDSEYRLISQTGFTSESDVGGLEEKGSQGWLQAFGPSHWEKWSWRLLTWGRLECQKLSCEQLSCGAPDVEVASSHSDSGEWQWDLPDWQTGHVRAGDLSLVMEPGEDPQPQDWVKAQVWEGRRSGPGLGSGSARQT